MGELDRVLTLSQEAEAMAQTLRDESRLARVYTYLVNYYYLKGEPELAIEYGERCLRIGETAQDRSLQALARGYLGSSYHAQGRFREAERVLRQNLEALGGAPTDSATIQNRISFVTSAAWVAFTHADLGDFDAAFEDLDQAAQPFGVDAALGRGERRRAHLDDDAAGRGDPVGAGRPVVHASLSSSTRSGSSADPIS